MVFCLKPNNDHTEGATFRKPLDYLDSFSHVVSFISQFCIPTPYPLYHVISPLWIQIASGKALYPQILAKKGILGSIGPRY